MKKEIKEMTLEELNKELEENNKSIIQKLSKEEIRQFEVSTEIIKRMKGFFEPKEPQKEGCNHRFAFYSSERTADGVSPYWIEYDVVICEKCGLTKRFAFKKEN